MKVEKDVIVFDIETQNTFADVGNGGCAKLLLSVAVAYFYKDNSYRVYTEENIGEFLPLLKAAELVIGFNIKGFDYPVLEKYFKEPLDEVRTLDILYKVHASLGRRIKLDYLAEATLGSKKSADGLMAVKFWRSGRIDELIDYCRQDVKLTKELYEFGCQNSYLLYRKYGHLEKIPVSWCKKENFL
ncbi:MAG: ribonuclease H-like domain-containing protein [Candidatus Omnitrophica bacterium]|nr:ribonuclease H-like domain-containing protein [Candidatus Omnitrophota bacterium]